MEMYNLRAKKGIDKQTNVCKLKHSIFVLDGAMELKTFCCQTSEKCTTGKTK